MQGNGPGAGDFAGLLDVHHGVGVVPPDPRGDALPAQSPLVSQVGAIRLRKCDVCVENGALAEETFRQVQGKLGVDGIGRADGGGIGPQPMAVSPP